MACRKSGEMLRQLRALFDKSEIVGSPIDAYIVPTDDSHQNEYVGACDARRAFISGFKGSAGVALITKQQALLWTDGRYFTQASKELYEEWTLMKDGVAGVPSIEQYLMDKLPYPGRVGADPKLIAYRSWKKISCDLTSAGHALVPIDTNLIDLVWNDRPKQKCDAVRALNLNYSGKRVADKLAEIRVKMAEKHARYLVVTALDEIAWLLNMRGTDIDYNPIFYAYVIIAYNPSVIHLFIDNSKLNEDVLMHLKEEGAVVDIQPYDSFYQHLRDLSKTVDRTSKVWASPTSSYAIAKLFDETHTNIAVTPLLQMKAIKNAVERAGMRNAHVKDAAALCVFFSWLEKQVELGAQLSEISVDAYLSECRGKQAGHMGASFPSISAVGEHAALPHYQSSPDTDTPITKQQIYLLDSGAQYLDGTTDVTRTMHFGEPSEYIRQCFTRVFKGQTQLNLTTFPNGVTGNTIDCLARKFLWDVGLDYDHGTGHGIGSFLCVHEGPQSISFKQRVDDPGLQAGMFVSDEPGYYEPGNFGIRIENIVEIVKADTPYNHQQRGFLTFDNLTLVPIQRKMLVKSMLTVEEIDFLNKFHAKCRDIVGKLLDEQNETEAKAWLVANTQPI